MKIFIALYFLVVSTLCAETSLFVEFGTTDYYKIYNSLAEISLGHAKKEKWDYFFMYGKQDHWRGFTAPDINPENVKVNPSSQEIVNQMVEQASRLGANADPEDQDDQFLLFLNGHGTRRNKKGLALVPANKDARQEDLETFQIAGAFSEMPKNVKKKIIATYCFDGSIHEIPFERDDTCSLSSTLPHTTNDFNIAYGFRFSEGVWREISSTEKKYDFDKDHKTSLWEAFAGGVELDGLNLNDARTSSLAYIDKLLHLESKGSAPTKLDLDFLEKMLVKHAEYFYYPEFKKKFCTRIDAAPDLTHGTQIEMLTLDLEKILTHFKKDQVIFPADKLGEQNAKNLQEIWDQSYERLMNWMKQERPLLDELFSLNKKYAETKARTSLEVKEDEEIHQRYKVEVSELKTSLLKIADKNSKEYLELNKTRSETIDRANQLMRKMNEKRREQKEIEQKIITVLQGEKVNESLSRGVGSLNLIDQLKKMSAFCENIQANSPHLTKLNKLLTCEFESI
jgi:hypothetical protein